MSPEQESPSGIGTPEHKGQELAPFIQEADFPDDSLGAELVRGLEGRRRFREIFSEPLPARKGRIGFSLPPRIIGRLNQEGVSTVFSLLGRSKEALSSIPEIDEQDKENIRKRLKLFAEDLKISPEVKLLGAIFGQEIPPSSAKEEEELREVLGEVFSTLTEREQRILSFRFRLKDGIRRTYKDIGRDEGVTMEYTRQIEAKALRKLRHPSRSRKLDDFLPLGVSFSAGSIAEREIFGPILVKEFKSLKEELGQLYPLFFKTLVALKSKISASDWEEVRGEIKEAFFREKCGLFPLLPEPVPELASEPVNFENRLLPDVFLSEEDRLRISQANLKDLGLSARIRNRLVWSLGEIPLPLTRIFSMSEEELLTLRQFGPVLLAGLKENLLVFLRQNPEEE